MIAAATLVGLAASPAHSAAASPARTPGDQAAPRSEAVAELSLEDCYDLWRMAGYGRVDFEQAAWVIRREHESAWQVWPSSRQYAAQVWQGQLPDGAVTLIHTHPDRLSPKPSAGDYAVAREFQVVVCAVSRQGVWCVSPDGYLWQEADDDWWVSLDH